MWLGVHITFMTGFKNRFRTLISWSLSFLGSGRTERTITALRIDR
jgi:NADH dehydrogenase